MKNILLIMLLATICLRAEDKFSKSEYLQMRTHYLKLMENAHPTISVASQNAPINQIPVFLLSDEQLSYFQNSNTIGDEKNNGNEKMQNESSIAVNPTNPKNLIASAVDYRDNSSTWVYVSDDGGKSWINKNLGKPFASWRSTNDPSVSFSDDGTAYLVYGGFEMDYGNGQFKGGNGVFFARSQDQGKTWTPHIPVIAHTAKQSLDSAFEDKYYIESDNSKISPYYHRLYNPWKRVITRDSSTQIVISHSTDKGTTWTKPVVVAPRMAYSSEDTTYGQSFPLAETAPNGDVYVVWNNGIKHAVGFNKSTDGGETWGEPRLIKYYNIFGVTKKFTQGWRHSLKGTVRAEAYPVIRCDQSDGPRKGWIYLTWAADRIPNIYFSRSTDGGNTWSDAKIIHSVSENDQFWQWLDVDPITGDLGVMYFDSRRFPDNMNVECWVSYSNDGGDSWIDRAASDISCDIRLNPFEENVFAGDYSGMAFYNGVMYPTWVDMRFAVADITDSDVFTAIIDTRAPLPPEDFSAKTLPTEPTKIAIKWVNPTLRSFGQELKTDEYKIILKRNGVDYKQFENIVEFTDTELTPYEKYSYEIYAQTNDGRSSKTLIADSWAGGSPLPSPCKIESIVGEDNFNVNLDIKIPTKRQDGVTPLVNLSKLNVYRDSVLIASNDLTPTDTGKVIKYTDNTTKRGWYKYYCTISDKFGDIVKESEPSNLKLVYSGAILLKNEADGTYTDDFERTEKYYSVGQWHITTDFAYNSTHSMTIAGSESYGQYQKDTLMLYPIANSNEIIVSFWHACIVHNNDQALLQVSYDKGLTWELFKSWNYKDNEPWQDNVLDSKDWKFETFPVGTKANEMIMLRFVFYSNNFKELRGWFIDDLELRLRPLSVADDVRFNIYPNPAGKYIILVSENINGQYDIYDIYGRLMISGRLSQTETRINTDALDNGVYFVKVNGAVKKIIKND
ncbi:MAG: exo-alpha-sialidase [bacterium]